MATREQLYRKFGPKIIEAQSRLIVSEINALRTHAGLAPRTQQQVLDALENELDGLSDYDWMNE